MDENDPAWDTDPLWYDRTESGPKPGFILEALAWLFLLTIAGCLALVLALVWLYRLPDRLWQAATRRLLGRGPADLERF